MSSDRRILQRNVLQFYPAPIALSWQRVVSASRAEERVRTLRSSLNVTLRYLVGFALADYLCSSRNPAIDSVRDSLETPSDGTLLQMLHALTADLANRGARGGTPPFCPPLARLLRNEKHKETAVAALLRRSIELRNSDAHNRANTPAAATELADEMHRTMSGVLDELVWLRNYRPFRVVDTHTGRGHATGRVQFLVGNTEFGEPQDFRLEHSLPSDGVFVHNAIGNEAMELSPMLHVAPQANGRDGVFLIEKCPKGRELICRHDDGDSIVRVAFVSPNNPHGEGLTDALARGVPDRRRPLVEQLGVFTSADHQASELGSVLAGRFDVKSILGRGGMATVYAVIDRHAASSTPFALKVMHEELVGDVVLDERFRREFQVLANLPDRHVVPVLANGDLPDGRRWILMPVMPWGSLDHKVKADGVDTRQALDWLTQMLETLAVLRVHGLVHRDIKPANFLFDADGRLRLADFGTVRGVKDRSLTRGESIGTTRYMAPETRDHGEASPASDVWSVAASIHELRTGTRSSRPGEGVDGPLGEALRAMGREDPTQRPDPSFVLDVLAGRNPTAQPKPSASKADTTTGMVAIAAATGLGLGLMALGAAAVAGMAATSPPNPRRRR